PGGPCGAGGLSGRWGGDFAYSLLRCLTRRQSHRRRAVEIRATGVLRVWRATPPYGVNLRLEGGLTRAVVCASKGWGQSPLGPDPLGPRRRHGPSASGACAEAD